MDELRESEYVTTARCGPDARLGPLEAPLILAILRDEELCGATLPSYPWLQDVWSL